MSLTMTPRERIVAAIRHQPTDLLPIDFGGMRSTGIAAIAYNKLKQHLGLEGGPTKVYDIFQQLAEPEEVVLRRLGGDVVQLHRLEPSFGISILEWKEDLLPDGSPCLTPLGLNPTMMPNGDRFILADGKPIASMSNGSLYYTPLDHPLANAETPADIDAFEFPRITTAELEFLGVNAKRMYEETDYAILGAFGGNILEGGQMLFGYERFMYLLAANPALVHYFCEKMTAAYLDDLEMYLDAVGDYIQIIQMGDDLGTQAGPQMSIAMYREMIKPYQARQYRYIRERSSSVAVFLHCCGSIYEYLADLIDAGVQIINPVQITAAGMDPVRLKRDFGKDICFWGGGARMQTTALTATVNELKREVRELIEIFAPGSGFVFNQCHNLLANIPPEKVLAIYDTALEYRHEQQVRSATRVH